MPGPLGLVDLDRIIGRVRSDANGILPKILGRAAGDGAVQVVERAAGGILQGDGPLRRLLQR